VLCHGKRRTLVYRACRPTVFGWLGAANEVDVAAVQSDIHAAGCRRKAVAEKADRTAWTGI